MKFRDDIPQWYKDTDNRKLILTDDIDSFLSCMLLKHIKNWEISFFFDFNNIYRKKNEGSIWFKDNVIGVDAALTQGKCFDNHATDISNDDINNPEAININQYHGVTNMNYTDKYAGSTLLELWSLYEMPIPKYEYGKLLLLAVDGTFQ